jgi:hypothetical protein
MKQMPRVGIELCIPAGSSAPEPNAFPVPRVDNVYNLMFVTSRRGHLTDLRHSTLT